MSRLQRPAGDSPDLPDVDYSFPSEILMTRTRPRFVFSFLLASAWAFAQRTPIQQKELIDTINSAPTFGHTAESGTPQSDGLLVLTYGENPFSGETGNHSDLNWSISQELSGFPSTRTYSAEYSVGIVR